MKRLFGITLLMAASVAGAQVKISQLPAGTALSGSELFVGVQSGATVSFTPGQIAAYSITQLSSGDISGLFTPSANQVWAGPASGSPTNPTFRALVSADIPGLIASSTSGNAATATALAATPTQCTSGMFSTGVTATGSCNSSNVLGSATVGTPTGGNEGAGSLNAESLFVNGTAVVTTTSGCTSGSFTASLNGFTAAPTGTLYYSLCGTTVWLYSHAVAITGTSNNASMVITGVPSIILPTASVNISGTCTGLEDNGNGELVGFAEPSSAASGDISITLASAGTYVIQNGSFTATGTKGLTNSFSCTYTIAD